MENSDPLSTPHDSPWKQLAAWVAVLAVLGLSFFYLFAEPKPDVERELIPGSTGGKNPERELRAGHWVYYVSTGKHPVSATEADVEFELFGSGTTADERRRERVRVKENVDYSYYSGRPGRYLGVAQDTAFFEVSYQLMQAQDRQSATVPAAYKEEKKIWVPRKALRRCPPEQADVDSALVGVTRVWAGTEATPLYQQTTVEGRLGDRVTVEIKDFDRWVFQNLDFGRLTGELAELDPKIKPYLEQAVATRRVEPLMSGIKRVNRMLRVSMRDKSESKKIQAWQELKRLVEGDPIMAKMKREIEPQFNWDDHFSAVTDQPTSDEKLEASLSAEAREARLSAILSIEEKFLPLMSWSLGFVERKFRALTLTINGVVIGGLHPLNAYNEAEVTKLTRPSFADDKYQWARFDLTRREAVANATETEEQAVGEGGDPAAWARLLGRPKLREAVRVTLTLPAAGGTTELALPTRVLAEPKSAPKFYLIGIEANLLYATLAVFACILTFLCWLARTTDILRDSTGSPRPDGIVPVSLAKTQMAFWFILTASAFAFLWVTTGEINTINTTCITLLGIGTGTALGAAFIPEGKTPANNTRYIVVSSPHHTRKQVENRIIEAIADRFRQFWRDLGEGESSVKPKAVALLRKLVPGRVFDEVAAELNLAKDAPQLPQRSVSQWFTEIESDLGDSVPASLAECRAVARQKEDFHAMAPTAWGRLFEDWLTENTAGSGFQFHRFQMLAWTLLLGLVFLSKLISERAMPEFGDMTLLLQVISGGTYIGFKLPGTQTSGGGAAASKPHDSNNE